MTEPQAVDPAVIGSLEPKPDESVAASARMPSCTPVDGVAKSTALFQRLQAARGRRLFVLATGTIDDDVLNEVLGWRADIKAAAKSGGLDVLLHSPGGVLSSCYQLARVLGTCANSWNALVPVWATSGATLISLGSAQLVIGDTAFLGPIDPQVASKRNEKLFASERQSPLEAFEAMKYLRTFALESLAANWTYFLRLRIAPKPALDAATNLAFHLVQPVLSKIEPYDLGSFALDSRLSLQYCERVGNPINADRVSQRKVKFSRLVEGYAAHEFVIDREEADNLGFELDDATPEVHGLFEEIRQHLESVESYVGLVPMSEEAA
jgi:hypothetical protein